LEEVRSEASAAIGPAVANVELRDRLDALHPDLRNRLDGAWERIHGGGADAAGQAANSLIEVIDWTLRTVAPDGAVLTWHAAEQRPEGELHNGKPTRPLRVRYAVRSHPEKAGAIELYARTTSSLVSVIQDPKHAIETRAVEALAPVALTVEGLLYYLVVD
jgi:Predicted pPIWI-associating nuclease